MKPFYWITKTTLRGCLKIFYGLKEYGVKHIPKGPGILASSHASFLDPPIISACYPGEASYLAKEELFVNPFFSFLIKNLNAYPVTDEGTRNLNSFKMILRLLGENKKVVIFPEGIRSPDGTIQPLKTGVAMIALRAECPVIPVYIHGSYEAWPKNHKYPQLGSKIRCVFGSPIYPKDFEHLDKKHAQEEITHILSEKIHSLKTWFLDGAKGTPP